MGRTKRARLRKKLSRRASSMDNEVTTINLNRWLVHNNWRNDTCLNLRKFPETGRGVSSTKDIKENDILIEVPFDLMITYSTLQEHLQEMISPHSEGLKIHDLLTMFLMFEKQNEKSHWKAYLDSLPLELPILPWLGTADEIKLYPQDLEIICEKNRETFMESMSRVKKSISQPDGCMLDENLFKWGYVLVNTRAVYVDSQIAATNGQLWENLLIDEPSMALCPFLDMFNHHYSANTESKIVKRDGKLFYQLQTLTGYRKYDQIFISYGAHDNVKLFMEYGFFIPGNTLDVVTFDLRNVLYITNVNLDQKRYKFIDQHGFKNDLYVGYNGFSFNLKAVLFVCLNEHCQDYSAVVFSDNYPEDFLRNTGKWTLKLLDYALPFFQTDVTRWKKYDFEKSENAKLMEEFAKYRVEFVNDLKNKLCK